MTLRTRFFALTYDRQMAGTERAGLAELRARLLAGAAGRVLEIGGGTGYASALLAQMAGETLSLERCQALAVEAAERLAAFGVDNVEVVFADGLTYRPVRRTFDRILVHGLIEAPATRLIEMLKPEGALVGAMIDEAASEQRIIRLAHAADGGIAATAHGPARAFSPLAEGLARAF